LIFRAGFFSSRPYTGFSASITRKSPAHSALGAPDPVVDNQLADSQFSYDQLIDLQAVCPGLLNGQPPDPQAPDGQRSHGKGAQSQRPPSQGTRGMRPDRYGTGSAPPDHRIRFIFDFLFHAHPSPENFVVIGNKGRHLFQNRPGSGNADSGRPRRKPFIPEPMPAALGSDF
jgi:hypothetical protein